MVTFDKVKLRKELEVVKASLARIEGLLGDATLRQEDPYERRRRLLQLIYEYDGMDRAALEPLLRESGTHLQGWVGQQVKRGFLRPPQKDDAVYRVTPVAIKELGLEGASEIEAWTRASMEAFAEDWDSDADVIYDEL